MPGLFDGVLPLDDEGAAEFVGVVFGPEQFGGHLEYLLLDADRAAEHAHELRPGDLFPPGIPAPDDLELLGEGGGFRVSDAHQEPAQQQVQGPGEIFQVCFRNGERLPRHQLEVAEDRVQVLRREAEVFASQAGQDALFLLAAAPLLLRQLLQLQGELVQLAHRLPVAVQGPPPHYYRLQGVVPLELRLENYFHNFSSKRFKKKLHFEPTK